MQAIEIKSLMELADRARQVRDAYSTVDPQRATFLARLGNLRELAGKYAISPAELVRQEADLAAGFRMSMETILKTPPGQSYVRPIAAPAPPDPAQQAAELLANLQAQEVELTAHRDGGLSVTPMSRLRCGQERLLHALQSHVVELLRRDVLTLLAPDPV